MSPLRNLFPIPLGIDALHKRAPLPKPTDPDGLILEAWAQGYMVGSLIIMAFITAANMRRGVLLHKLILLELLLGIWQGFWLFFRTPVYAWWLSVGAIFLNTSWSLHNVISWMKIKPFLSPLMSKMFIISIILVQPYWVVEIYANFAYFHNINELFLRTRPWEALCRDPWWIITTVWLMWTIKTQYDLTAKEILRISPRFGIMLGSMLLSIVFIILDVCSVTGVFASSNLPTGINPFWKLAFVFKCLTDMIVLDDFKTALDRLRAFKLGRMGVSLNSGSLERRQNSSDLIKQWERLEDAPRKSRSGPFPSPDGALLNAGYFPGPSRKQPSHPNFKRGDDEESARHPTHKDSGITPDISRSGSLSRSRPMAPEDMVPSALYDPPFMNMESAHIWDGRSHELSRYQGTADSSPSGSRTSLPPPKNDPKRRA